MWCFLRRDVEFYMLQMLQTMVAIEELQNQMHIAVGFRIDKGRMSFEGVMVWQMLAMVQELYLRVFHRASWGL